MENKPGKIKKILLTQPNYAWFSKRTWQFPPYTLCLLRAAIKRPYEALVFDPNFRNLSQEEVCRFLKSQRPDIVGISSVSTEYFSVTRRMIELIRRCLPDAVIVVHDIIADGYVDEILHRVALAERL